MNQLPKGTQLVSKSYDSNTGSLTAWPGQVTIYSFLFLIREFLLRTNRPILHLLSFFESLLASSFFMLEVSDIPTKLYCAL